LGFEILATTGTAEMLRRNGVDCSTVAKVTEVDQFLATDGEDNGQRSNGEAESEVRTVVDYIRDGEVDLVINTPAGSDHARSDGYEIRSATVNYGVPCVTTVQGIVAAVQGIEARLRAEPGVYAIQDVEHA